MKRSMVVFAAVCLMAFGCSDDKEGEPEVSIVGTWTAVDIVRDNCYDGNNSTIKFDCDNNFCDVYTFKSDGTLEDTYTDPNNGTTTSKGTYTLKGNELTLCDSDGACETLNIELSADKLVFTTFEEDEAGSGQGCDLTINLTRTN